MKLLLMADGKVGFSIAEWLLSKYPGDIGVIVVRQDNRIAEAVRRSGVPLIISDRREEIRKSLQQFSSLDLGLLAWWPDILKEEDLKIPEHGFLNTHPSLLPYNRGKHYNFWALVEQCPFGVTLHRVTPGIDDGDIVAQVEIPYGWEDTGGTLYERAAAEMISLFCKEYPRIRLLDFQERVQPVGKGSFHLARELDPASKLNLEEQMKVRDLLNLLRARTFPPHPGCSFVDQGQVYQVRVTIEKKT